VAGSSNGLNVKPRASQADLARVRFLAATLYDWARHVKTSTGMIVALGAKPGEVPSKFKPCPRCEGEGMKRVRGIPMPCERCSATGRIKVDAYTGRERVAGDESLSAHYEHLNRDPGTRGDLRAEERERNESELARMQAAIEGTDDAYTAACSAKDRQYERGSYAELERVWLGMREREYRRYRDFGRFCVHGLEIQSPRMQGRVNRLVLLVALRMDKPILPAHVPVLKEPTRQRRSDLTATGERNAEIRRLHGEEGWKQARLAREFGLSQSAVSKIVATSVVAA
jgi:hypothetical protein